MWYVICVEQWLSIRKLHSLPSVDHTKNLSTLAKLTIYPIIVCHSTCPMMGKEAMYPFKFRHYRCWKTPSISYSRQKYPKMGPNSNILLLKNLISIENEHHIRNQQTKINRKPYVSLKKIPSKFHLYSPRGVFTMSFTM